MTCKLDTAGLVERQDNRITQKYLRRYPDSKRTRSWAGALVHIETENGVWRKGGSGYTYAGRDDAWVLPFEEAQRHVAHCGPEKRAAFIRAEALTQAAVPDMEPVAYRWTTSDINGDDWPWTYTGKAGADIHSSHDHTVEPLYSASQLSALQERVDALDAECQQSMLDICRERERAEAAEARIAELEGRPDENGFVIGHPVEKFTGEARWEGTLVASYLTTKGKRRYVVEVHPQGFQMIAVPAQLRMIAALTDDEDGAALAHKGEGR